MPFMVLDPNLRAGWEPDTPVEDSLLRRFLSNWTASIEAHVLPLGGGPCRCDWRAGAPMQRGTIFCISSMSKPVTAVAAMILEEECKLRLDEPVDELQPQLAGRRVLKRLDGPLDETMPAKWPITLPDLLTFRMGFG